MNPSPGCHNRCLIVFALPEPKSIYFAMYLGDTREENISRFSTEGINSSECSLDVNINNTRKAIEAMRNQTFQYSFILYTNTARSTPPRKALDAITILASIEPDMGAEKFNQSTAIEEFSSQSNGNADSVLIYYMPCEYDFNKDDIDTKLFVQRMERYGHRGRTMIVSNTDTALAVERFYNHPKEQIVGKDESDDFIEKIVCFASSLCKYSSPTTTATSSYLTTTEEQQKSSSTEGQYSKSTRYPTLMPISTSSPTATSTIMTTSTESPREHNAHCVIVVDLYNFGDDESKYEKEKQFVKELGVTFFSSRGNLTAGLAFYGYVKNLPFNLNPALNDMKSSAEDFVKKVDAELWLRNTVNPSNTREAIQKINSFTKIRGRANCMIIISEQENTKDLPPLDPPRDWKRIVAVGFNGTNLTRIVSPTRGKAISVPYKFTDKDVEEVVNGVFEGI
ncbi:hypothetical protein Y032_0809g2457 [Ancylostoma ceylanicum]|uniref:VWFA domain-containing protein n=1 Tax=Ancylostoma ceylanicum TaxID=53326 RepID=A0A016WDB3_9BILA|nr:hypothetical protein Y032_0809g2457 [Ancylostoma ceylanicum]